MIWYYVILFVTSLLTAVFSWLPLVTQLPFGIDTYLVGAVGYVNAFTAVFWPFQPVWNCLLWYMPFKTALMTIRLFVGSRTPDAS